MLERHRNAEGKRPQAFAAVMNARKPDGDEVQKDGHSSCLSCSANSRTRTESAKGLLPLLPKASAQATAQHGPPRARTAGSDVLAFLGRLGHGMVFEGPWQTSTHVDPTATSRQQDLLLLNHGMP